MNLILGILVTLAGLALAHRMRRPCRHRYGLPRAANGVVVYECMRCLRVKREGVELAQ